MLRPGDVVISTSMKAGTTWMQRIMSLLVFGAGPLPAPLPELSPWIDSAFMGDVDGMAATIEAQEHQRFLKSHLPFDALPYDPAVRYICVGRDTRDVFMSAFNHYSGYTELTYSLLDAVGGAHGPMPRCPATERELWVDWMTRSLFDWETDGWPFWSHHHHAASFWPCRDLPNVLMVHYADLLSDLDGQMRRVAAFTGIEVAEEAWPELVAAARFDTMKQEAISNAEYMGLIFEGGAGRFFHKGTNGRWRDVLTAEDLSLYETAAAQLDPELRAWLEADSGPRLTPPFDGTDHARSSSRPPGRQRHLRQRPGGTCGTSFEPCAGSPRSRLRGESDPGVTSGARDLTVGDTVEPFCALIVGRVTLTEQAFGEVPCHAGPATAPRQRAPRIDRGRRTRRRGRQGS